MQTELATRTLAIVTLFASLSGAQQLTVSIFNLADVQTPVLLGAVDTARLALRTASIRTHWIVCGTYGCDGKVPAEDLSFDVFLVPRMKIQVVAAEHAAGYSILGPFSPPRAYAFYDAISAIAERTTRPAGLVLGCVLIHEIGHLLGLKDQPGGVMRANVDPLDMDNTTRGRAFTLDELKHLRSWADARHKTVGDESISRATVTSSDGNASR